MSLLMQALKKAERNQRDALPDDDEPALPSEMYDRVLALTPDDVLSGRVPPAPEWSLEPQEFQYEADAPAGGVSEQIPVLQPAAPAPHDPTPPRARRKAEPKREAAARPGAATGTAAIAALSGLPPGPVHAERQELSLHDVPAPLRPTEPISSHVEIQPDVAGLLSGTPIAPMTAIATGGALALMPLDAIDTPPDKADLTLTAAPAPQPVAIGDAGEPPGHHLVPGALDAGAPGAHPAGTGSALLPAADGARTDAPYGRVAIPAGAKSSAGAGAESVAHAHGAHRAGPVATGAAGAGAANAGFSADQAFAPAGSGRPGGTAPEEPAASKHGAQSTNPDNTRPGSASHAGPANAYGAQTADQGSARPGGTAHTGPATHGHGSQSVAPGGAACTEPAAGAHGTHTSSANGQPSSRDTPPGQSPGKKSPGAAARARAAAKAAAEQDRPGRDPARVRLAVLGGVLALVAGTLAGVYWYALTSPGPGAKLPPVPMPPPGAPAGPAAIVVAPPAGQPDGLTPPAPDAAQAAASAANAPSYAGAPHAVPQQPAPHSGSRMPSDDDLQRALQQPGPGAAAGAPPTPASQLPRNELPPGYVAPQNAAPATPAPPVTPATTGTSATPSTATDIHVARNATPQRINPVLQEGYQAFMTGDLATAAQSYASALRQDPNNRDALLGSAAVAARRNDTATATAGYVRLLELNPSDPDAQAGLLALRPGDSSQSELRLKELLRREPGSGPLEFALGNLYAQQGRWPDAQQAYFRAYTATPDNADYAFNLAVGLDQLNQRKLALTYYQRALDLSRTAPAVFDRNAARRRADQITASLPPPQQPQAQPHAAPPVPPAPGTASAPPAAALPPPTATAAFTPPAPPAPQTPATADGPVPGAASAARQSSDGAPPGRAGYNGRQP